MCSTMRADLWRWWRPKSWRSGHKACLRQARRYAQALPNSPFNWQGYRVPFVYSTNGQLFWFEDLRNPQSRSRQVSGFHAPEAMDELLDKDSAIALRWLHENANDLPLLRPYQREAIQHIEEALRQGKRKMLLAMATGTGKTLTTVALLYRLLRSGLARRILFLVDRRVLAAQAAPPSQYEVMPGLKFDKVYEVYSQRLRPRGRRRSGLERHGAAC